MDTKLFEIRDRATCFAVFAIKTISDDATERQILKNCGYGQGDALYIIGSLNKGRQTYNAYDWGDRTYTQAHLYIQDNWNSLQSGDVIDVEFILGEKSEKATPELRVAF